MATSDNKMADTDEKIFIGKGEQPVWLTLGLANRHGLVAGATGTGKTVSLQVMAEGFARAGVPVFGPISRETFRASLKSARPRILSSNGPAIWASPSSPTGF